MTGRLLAVAHRAGNDVAALREALDAGVDLVEADVHLFRGELEMRHLKTLGSGLLWDRWVLARRRDTVLPQLAEVLAAMPDDHRLMLDLKAIGSVRGAGVDSAALAPRVAEALREAAPGVPITVCTKHWRMLDAFGPPVRRVFSASNRATLARLLARLRRAPAGHVAHGVSIKRRLLTPATVAELRRHVPMVLVWSVETEAELEHARRLGVTGVISKNLDLLRRVITHP